MCSRATGVAIVAALLGGLTWIACVGEDPPANGARAGERGGPCNAGSCLSGLSCVDGVCVLVDGRADAAPDGATDPNDGGDTNDGAAVPCPALAFEAARVRCPGAPDGACAVDAGAAAHCCVYAKTCGGGCPSVQQLRCESAGHCDVDAGERCCLAPVLAIDPSRCPSAKGGFDGTICSASCDARIEVCNVGDPAACKPGEVCRRAEVGVDRIPLGVCSPR